MHVNNGRYLSIMDLGRLDLMFRAKMFWSLMLSGYYPVVVSEGIRFKKALMPFQFFQIKTQIEHWTEKDIYIRQEFLRNKRVIAEGYVKARFLHRKKGSVSTEQLFKLLNLEYKKAAPNRKAEALNELDSNLANPV